jgi:SAM-dependent methyltransferase
MSFKDHFSRQSAAYRRFRPGYPSALFKFVASRAPGRQLASAEPRERVYYAAALAEQLPVRERSVSLVTVAQSVHWFDFGRFHAECRRVLVPGGLLAVWSYGKFRVDAAVDAVIDRFYSDVVGPYWPPERRYVDQGYRTLPFPWREEAAPDFGLETDWDLEEVMGYLATWSAVQRYKDQLARDPLPGLRTQLAALWPSAGTRRLRWPIHLRIGRA